MILSVFCGPIAFGQQGVTVFGDPAGDVTTPSPLSEPAETTGWDLLSTIFRYNPNTDVLQIRLQFDGIAGDADGDGDPGSGTITSGGTDVADLGVGEHLAIAFNFGNNESFDFITGVRPSGAINSSGSTNLVLAEYEISDGIEDIFGAPVLTGSASQLVSPPSASSPDAVIQISNWSSLASNSEQFSFQVFAGSDVDGSYGSEFQNGVANLAFVGRSLVTFTDAVNDVGLAPGATSTGWNISRATFQYDGDTDEMEVTIAVTGIAGDADGDGDPASSSINGVGDAANLGASETMYIALDLDQDGLYDLTVGVPNDEELDPSTLALKIANYNGPNPLAVFGTDFISPATAVALHNPSAENPDLIMNITNWSALTITPYQFDFQVFAGSLADGGFGEDELTREVALETQVTSSTGRFLDGIDVGVNPGSSNFSGWDFETLDFEYNSRTDILSIDIGFHGNSIAGDADGDGDPGARSVGSGADNPNLGSGETITLTFDLDGDGTPDKLVGIPTDESLDPATLALRITDILPNAATGQNYGADDTSGATASVVANPSAEHPNFTVNILGWSRLDADDPTIFEFRAFAGSTADTEGEDNIPNNPQTPPQVADLFPPTQVTSIEMMPNGDLCLGFLSKPDRPYEVVATTDLDVDFAMDDLPSVVVLSDGGETVMPDGSIIPDFIGGTSVIIPDAVETTGAESGRAFFVLRSMIR